MIRRKGKQNIKAHFIIEAINGKKKKVENKILKLNLVWIQTVRTEI